MWEFLNLVTALSETVRTEHDTIHVGHAVALWILELMGFHINDLLSYHFSSPYNCVKTLKKQTGWGPSELLHLTEK